MDPSNAGIFLVVVGGALCTLLLLAGRAGRGLAKDLWSRMGLLRWIILLIVVVVLLDLADGAVNR
ncbi:hypothetical protein [Frankia sp. Cr2]|uniref:hypothetical protein n=1 Tax=Frankia sp. Cr2 TaxID=3073932 RepID=UPI002AD1F0F0|nr:hypothetical protein [Frankia sp. Cr2]